MKCKKIFGTLVIILVIIITLIVFLRLSVTFTLKGKKNYTLNIGEQYVEPGFISKLGKINLNKKVKVFSNLDTNKIGEYQIFYNLSFLGKEKQNIRNIKVVDLEKPTITLIGKDIITIYNGNSYVELGAKAIDNYDGDISSKINILGNVNTNKNGTYELIYNIKDSMGNKNSITRKVIVISNPILDYIKKNNLNVSIGYYNLENGKTYFYLENKVRYGASLIKTLDALYLYEHNMVTPKIEEEIRKAIVYSDNDSHKYLVDYIGKEKLRKYGLSIGAKHALLGPDYYGNTTVYDQICFFKKVWEVCQNNLKLKSFFLTSIHNYLKVNNIPTLCKYGLWHSTFHNAGIVVDKQPYIVVILTNHGTNNYAKIIGDLSNLIYKYHQENNN